MNTNYLNYGFPIIFGERLEILNHVLVPKHIILSNKEKEKVLKMYRATLKQLPRILANDPVVKAIGAKPGDVIKIIRKDPTLGESIYYRVVIKG